MFIGLKITYFDEGAELNGTLEQIERLLILAKKGAHANIDCEHPALSGRNRSERDQLSSMIKEWFE